ncbi:hypothetical protein SEA_CEPENS_48 [Mycobacterium phage Cepens]|nr:hypothetical protein PBI_MEGABEAR_48 [Mycobacterium phage Megabear]QBP32712.1 hypothetical protein SEA_CEPENS_48 [Mycobacterium phage Cepens]WRQ08206.1 hypothetical protein JDBV14_00460 [Mycobacterium phage harman]BBC28572.1 hypothetical protein [Mycobacterium phage D12]BBC28662.1 hypothetical protein [Mycobacterium phage PR]
MAAVKSKIRRGRVVCLGCGHSIEVVQGRYSTHHAAEESAYCFMSGMPQPFEGRDEESMRERARIVACLAAEVQDSDPHQVWKYLGAVPPEFVRELLQVALAGLDVDGKRPEDIWAGWGAA